MSWLESDRRVHSDEGIYGAVVINENLEITHAEGDKLFAGGIETFFTYFGLEYGKEEEELLRRIIQQKREAVVEVLSSKETLNLIVLPLESDAENRWLLLLKRRDVTLNELEEIKHNILANISHELLTPITIAKASLEIIDPTPEEEEILSTAMNAIVRLEKLLRDLVRMRQAPEESTKKPLRVDDVVRQALGILHKTADGRGIQIKTRIEDNLPEIIGDRDALVHLLLLLLNNAIKFSPEGGVITISAGWIAEERSLSRGKVQICIEDRGIGVPPEEQERIFDLFYQIDRGPSRRYGGVGLGLFLARSIVTGHGGRIWVESAPGEGSRFCFTLPTSPGIEKRRL